MTSNVIADSCAVLNTIQATDVRECYILQDTIGTYIVLALAKLTRFNFRYFGKIKSSKINSLQDRTYARSTITQDRTFE